MVPMVRGQLQEQAEAHRQPELLCSGAPAREVRQELPRNRQLRLSFLHRALRKYTGLLRVQGPRCENRVQAGGLLRQLSVEE